MRRWAFSLLLLALVCGLAAKQDFIGLRAGFLAPADAKTGFMFGFSNGWIVDDAVQVKFDTDFYLKNYSEKRDIGYHSSEGGNTVTTVRMTSDINTYFIPLDFGVRVQLPVDFPVQPYLGGAIGWGFLWEDVFVAADSTHGEVNGVKFYTGFDWNLSGGGRLPLGERSWLTGELYYNGGAMKRNLEHNAAGVTWDEIDMSGLGMRIGVEFRY